MLDSRPNGAQWAEICFDPRAGSQAGLGHKVLLPVIGKNNIRRQSKMHAERYEAWINF